MKTTLAQLDSSWKQRDYAAVRQILKRTTKERAMNFAVLVALRDGGDEASTLLRLMVGYDPAPAIPSGVSSIDEADDVVLDASNPPLWADRNKRIPSLAEERWRIVDEGDRWVVWFVPLNHPHLWREIASFDTEMEAKSYAQSC